MGSPGQLALACRPGPPAAVGNVFKAAPSNGAKIHRLHVLDEYLKALEDERRKIEAFKRELPHCMQLLDYAIDASKENLVTSSSTCSPNHPVISIVGKTAETLGLFGKHMVQEFLKSRRETRKDEDSDEYEKEKARKSSSSAEGGDYPTWMAEAQLWREPTRSDLWREKESSTDDSVGWKKESTEKSTVTSSPALLFNGKQRPGGAFMPFVKEKPVPVPVVRAKAGVSELVLSSSDSRRTPAPGFGATDKDAGARVEISAKAGEVSSCVTQGKEAAAARSNGGGSITYSGCTESTTSGGSQRKARRCWSPELHRRFVNALQQLGGSQIATPKQIRELMKVDGLTNDEVKSHLQKYRLHTRRPSPTPQGHPQATPAQLVVLGGLWVPPEYGSATIYHDPSVAAAVSQPEPIFCQPYSQLRPSVQLELQHRSQSDCSPQDPLQSTSNLSSGARQASGEGCRDESIGEDGKSESSSWKGEHNSRESSVEKETSLERKYDSDNSKGDHQNDTDDNETTTTQYEDSDGGGVRLQLGMSCSSAQRSSIKPEPQTT